MKNFNRREFLRMAAGSAVAAGIPAGLLGTEKGNSTLHTQTQPAIIQFDTGTNKPL